MYYPDGEPYCRYGELVDCPEEEDDKCGTLSFTLGSNYRGKVWNCTRSTHDDCNEEEICDHMRDVAADIDDTIESCSVTCCDGDGCNHQGKMEEHVYALYVVLYFFTLCITAQKDLDNEEAAGVCCVTLQRSGVSYITRIL